MNLRGGWAVSLGEDLLRVTGLIETCTQLRKLQAAGGCGISGFHLCPALVPLPGHLRLFSAKDGSGQICTLNSAAPLTALLLLYARTNQKEMQEKRFLRGQTALPCAGSGGYG